MVPLHVLVVGDPASPPLLLLRTAPPGVTFTLSTDLAVLAEAAPTTDAALLCMGNSDGLRPLWGRFRRLRWVHSLSAGVDLVLFPELVDSAVTLTNARGVFAVALAEFAVAGMLFFAKGLRRLLRQQAERTWRRFDMVELHGQRLVIVGYGAIGRAVATRARALGMDVVGIRRRPGAAVDELGVAVCGTAALHGALAEAHHVVVAVPLAADTRGLIGRAELAAVRPGAVLVNIGRGPVVDQDALVEALRTGHLRGAALDVFTHEPLPPDSPLWRMDNVLISPHCADQTASWLHQSTALFLDNLRRFTAGEPLLNVVDKRLGY
ncbi:MAG: D-2-hydroxyacid dehydrogenase [Deltaproteobacteria bacterium]|nr:D-2-hydroxyacid dehydrogenase [Deltaproteobacteria bacterium]